MSLCWPITIWTTCSKRHDYYAIQSVVVARTNKKQQSNKATHNPQEKETEQTTKKQKHEQTKNKQTTKHLQDNNNSSNSMYTKSKETQTDETHNSERHTKKYFTSDGKSGTRMTVSVLKQDPNTLPSTGQGEKIAQPKTNKWLRFLSHFSSFSIV